MLIRLLKPGKGVTIEYEGEPVGRDATWVAVATAWERDTLDLGLLRFEPGDRLVEYFYSDRWYNVFQIHAPGGELRGWYCNITRPALIADDYVESEDLELDLLVSPGRAEVRLDDEEEYAARDLQTHDPAAHAAAMAALEELRGMVARGEPPFDW